MSRKKRNATHGDTTAVLEFMNVVDLRGAAVGWVERERDAAFTRNDQISGFVLISMGMTANHNGLSPARDEARDVFDENGLTENNAAKQVSDCAVGRFPHLFQAEFFDARFIAGRKNG
jgi:phosphoribosylaminoimidazole (AIR) synthetase